VEFSDIFLLDAFSSGPLKISVTVALLPLRSQHRTGHAMRTFVRSTAAHSAKKILQKRWEARHAMQAIVAAKHNGVCRVRMCLARKC